MSGDDAFRAMLASALDQALRNACELAGGPAPAEHLHQCRVGLRRLRCALRDFAPLAAAPPDVAAWREQLAALFRRLGQVRDRDALRENLLPQLLAAGAPMAELPAPPQADEDPGAVLREPAANRLWLDILGAIHSAGTGPAAADRPPLTEQLRPILRHLHRQVARDAAPFAALDQSAQHRTRKRLKRLRYGAEFCSSLYPAKAVARYLALLRPAQDALGAANDLVIARALFEPAVASDPRAWFVLGWLAGRRDSVLSECGDALADIADAHGFWRHAKG